MSYFFQIIELKKKDLPDLGLTDVVSDMVVTMVCDHLGARRLLTKDVILEEPTSSDNFTDYESLTESQVQAWVESSLGSDMVTSMRLQLEQECELCINVPDSISSVPPWVNAYGEED